MPKHPLGSLGLALILVFQAACPDEAAKPSPPTGATVLPDIRVDARRTDLVFTYLDPKTGSFESTEKISDVPPAAKKQVVVVDLSLSPEQRRAGQYIYVADLTRARSDGSYPVAVASRFGFETGLTESSTVAGPAAGKHRVIVYSASWCGVCKRAMRFLDQLGVPYEEKDIEASKKVAAELAAKAASAGIRPGGVPVIDVGGTLLQGFDARTLEDLLKERGFLASGT